MHRLTRAPRRALTIAAVTAGALAVPAAAGAVPTCGTDSVACPPPSQPVAHVGKFNGGKKPFVNIRSAPSSDSARVRRVRSGAKAFIVCQTRGAVARGPYGRSRIWNQLRAGGYASDTRVFTGSDGRVAPNCDTGGGQPPQPVPDRFRYDDPGPWIGAKGCSGGYTAGANAVKAWLQRKFRFTSSIGGYSCRPNTADTSQTSLHGEGRALDWFANAGVPAQRKSVDRFVRRVSKRGFRLGRAMGIQELIFNDRIWTASRHTEGFREYTGPNPHTDHIHIGLNRPGAAKRTSFYRR